MTPKDLKTALRSFFARYKRPDRDVQLRLKDEAMASFRAAQNRQALHQWVFWRRASFALMMVMTVTVLGFFTSTFTPNKVKAGTILAEYGPVEVIRGEESFLVRDEADIFVGDLVRVGTRGEAKLNLLNQGVSTIEEKTHLIVTDVDALFIEKGRLASEAFRGVEVATDRGMIRTTPGARVSFEVSETGQTKIVPEKNVVEVFDLHDGQALLTQGEELTLHSDTQLSLLPRPSSALLNEAQIEALQAKLVITRTKLIGAIEAQLAGRFQDAADEFVSAENSFKSLTQVLLTSRQVEIARRKNVTEIDVSQVYDQLSSRVNHAGILTEVASLTEAFAYFQNQAYPSGVTVANTGDNNLDRYLLLKRLADRAGGAAQIAFNDLASKYIVNFLRPIQDQPLLADQIAILQEKISVLPANADTYYFLRRVGQKMSPDLRAVMDQELTTRF